VMFCYMCVYAGWPQGTSCSTSPSTPPN
jgi:hypothetical protein